MDAKPGGAVDCRYLLKKIAYRTPVGPAVKPRGPWVSRVRALQGRPLVPGGKMDKPAPLHDRKPQGFPNEGRDTEPREGHRARSLYRVLWSGQWHWGPSGLIPPHGSWRGRREEQRAREGTSERPLQASARDQRPRRGGGGTGVPMGRCPFLCPSRAREGSQGRSWLSPPPGGAPPRGRPEDPFGASQPTPPQAVGHAPWAGVPRFRHGVPPMRSPSPPCVSTATNPVSVRTGVSATAQVSVRTAPGRIRLCGRDGCRRPPLAVGVGTAQPGCGRR